jgi:hypothetical protein
VSGLDVRRGPPIFVDRGEEISPKKLDVVAVGLLELRVFVDRLVARCR